MSGVRKKIIVDRISALPDILIQHILSFLPSTKETIRTGILSKRWKDQWTHVPVLILKSTGMSDENFIKYTDKVLLSYDSFKIKKFYIQYDNIFKQMDPHFPAKVRFATRRNVEELILNCDLLHQGKYRLPEFVFESDSLVKLHCAKCKVMPNTKVSWACLSELSLSYCSMSSQAIKSLLSGSPLLQRMELISCYGFGRLVVFSDSLKRLLVLQDNLVLEISCPNLVELTVSGSEFGHLKLSNELIEKVLSSSVLLKTLDLCRCEVFGKLVIASQSLRQLSLKELQGSMIDISCPNLEELKLEDLKGVGSLNLKN